MAVQIQRRIVLAAGAATIGAVALGTRRHGVGRLLTVVQADTTLLVYAVAQDTTGRLVGVVRDGDSMSINVLESRDGVYTLGEALARLPNGIPSFVHPADDSGLLIGGGEWFVWETVSFSTDTTGWSEEALAVSPPLEGFGEDQSVDLLGLKPALYTWSQAEGVRTEYPSWRTEYRCAMVAAYSKDSSESVVAHGTTTDALETDRATLLQGGRVSYEWADLGHGGFVTAPYEAGSLEILQQTVSDSVPSVDSSDQEQREAPPPITGELISYAAGLDGSRAALALREGSFLQWASGKQEDWQQVRNDSLLGCCQAVVPLAGGSEPTYILVAADGTLQKLSSSEVAQNAL